MTPDRHPDLESEGASRNVCSYCGGVLSPAATACPRCGHPNQAAPASSSKAPPATKKPKSKGPVIAADVSVVVAFVLNIFAPQLYVLSILLYVAAFVLSIVALTRGRAIGDAIVVLIASVVLPFLGMGFSCWRGAIAP